MLAECLDDAIRVVGVVAGDDNALVIDHEHDAIAVLIGRSDVEPVVTRLGGTLANLAATLVVVVPVLDGDVSHLCSICRGFTGSARRGSRRKHTR
jgi:hypothetical protein